MKTLLFYSGAFNISMVLVEGGRIHGFLNNLNGSSQDRYEIKGIFDESPERISIAFACDGVPKNVSSLFSGIITSTIFGQKLTLRFLDEVLDLVGDQSISIKTDVLGSNSYHELHFPTIQSRQLASQTKLTIIDNN